MTLAELLPALNGMVNYEVLGDADREVSGVSYDSRNVKQGALFCCIKGFQTDGHRFIRQAVENGAAIVCVCEDADIPQGVTVLKVDDCRKALALLACAFYGFPADRLALIGVTGTNGKTTTVFMIDFLLHALGFKTGLSGTMYTRIGDLVIPAKTTTPESLDLQALLAKMCEYSMEGAVFEVSSHALKLDRVAGCRFDRAVFTNLTQDHLDFHDNFEDYFASKLKLFTSLKANGKDTRAIVNGDDPWGRKILRDMDALTYGVQSADLDFQASQIDVSPDRIRYMLTHKGERAWVEIPLSGFFNVYNSLAAIATVHSLGYALPEIVREISSFCGVKGRFESIRCGQNFSVIVDYAHTPDGLKNVLSTAKAMTAAKLFVVFGCGGDRDRSKRPLMGGIAAELSDEIFITSDNPRTEDPAVILDDIENGVKPYAKPYKKIVDRRRAIGMALAKAGEGDTVVIAGKGHETYQIFKNETIHFDDGEVVTDFFTIKN